MKLLLHIGTEKTGTTLLQEWLYANKEALSEQGVFLSKVCGSGNNRRLVSYCQSSLDEFTETNRIMTLEDKERYFRGFSKKFQAEIAKASKKHHSMVITSEHFHSRIQKPEEVARLKSLFEGNFESVKVLCYLRPQWDLRESLYSTAVKYGNTGAIENFQSSVDTEGNYYNYYNLAEFWAGAFGKENTELRVYDRNGFFARRLAQGFPDSFTN
ncbi:hypothetical protein [Ruegeria lacuscaerulensis]|uniref:hypothetical protein n=1 Tax=Ruegeria lacuscaerulensis TaxID=55218 RepID=UPI0014805F70|nr:hypothetical protein [Ruegeria lacuscaerulensis]